MMPVFAQPFWLIIGLLACVLTGLFIRFSTVQRQKKLAQFAAPHLLPLLTAHISYTRRRLKAVLFIMGIACLFLALARPQWGSRWIEVRRKGIDILIAFDVSKSMLAPDIKPNRLQRAKLAVRDFTAKLDGDRIGLLPFAGTSFLSCPLTTDYDAFNASLSTLDIEIIPKGGTNIGSAIKDASKMLTGELNYKILILITDGEDLSKDALKAAALAKQEKMIIYTVGVGTPQGELIPLPGGGAGNFIKDEQGEFVTSKLDEQMLTALAETTGGIYVPLGNMGQGLDTIYQRKLALIPKEDQAQRKQKVQVERFQWPIGAALLLLSVEFLLIGRRRKLRLPFIFTAGRRKKQQTAATVLLLGSLCTTLARADKGNDLYQAGKYEQAITLYQKALTHDSNNQALHFNLGASLHKQGKYGPAAEEFSKALQTDDLILQAKSYFNRGISRYQAGRVAEQAGDVELAIEQLKQAQHSFQAALQLKPENKKAGRNLEIVETKLAELKKKQKQEQPQSQNEESKPKQEKNSPDSKKQQPQEKKSGSENGDKAHEPQKKQAAEEPQQQYSQKNNAAKNDQEQEKQQNAVPAPDKEQKKANAPAPTLQKQESQTDKPPQEQKEGTKMITGNMTKEEAQSLLDSLKGEQGELNFIPQEAADDSNGRDW